MTCDGEVGRALAEAIRRAVVTLPPDIVASLEAAYAAESSETPRSQLRAILDNLDMAGGLETPLCQDTGIPLFFVTCPESGCKSYRGEITRAIERATGEVPLRPNVVDPLTRENTRTNTGMGMPHIVYSHHGRPYTDIVYMPKGAGSENMSVLRMLTPADGALGVKRTVLDAVVGAGGNPCPPTIVGVGIGGSACMAPLLAKRALLRPLGTQSADPLAASLEKELSEELNRTGIGPMGLGGATTVLGVHIETAGCHTASLPVAVTLQCWAARRAGIRIHADGGIEQI